MSVAAIEEILQKIRHLPEQDRILLEQRLTEMEEAEWRQEAGQARGLARQKGITQVEIDEAVRGLRRPS